MPFEVGDVSLIERLQLIRELYSEDQYLEGIKESTILKGCLQTSAQQEKYYCEICKLLCLGYRKRGKLKSALNAISDGILYCDRMLEKTKDSRWERERASLQVNKGIVFEMGGNMPSALEEYYDAELIFQQQQDTYHLALLYQTIILALCKIHDSNQAEEYLQKLQQIESNSDLRLNDSVDLLSAQIKEIRNEDL